MPQRSYPLQIIAMEDISDLSGDVTVVDVYDIASDIGKECKKIIDGSVNYANFIPPPNYLKSS